MKKLFMLIAVVMLTTSFAVAAWADNASKEECVVKVKEAAAFIQNNGIDAGIKAISDKKGRFVWKDTYVFLMDLDGKMIAHPIKPELTQKGPLLNVSDAAGKQHFAEFVKTANDPGEGWVDYMYSKKGMSEPKAKTSYIYRVPGTQYLLGAGIYK